jgi:uncharacterized cupredoxin-like copper-binding protein
MTAVHASRKATEETGMSITRTAMALTGGMAFGKPTRLLLQAACAVLALAACVGGEQAQDPAPAVLTDWGGAGDAKAARRTIRITISEDLRFSPTIVEVGHGETVRFEVRNAGSTPHEMAIGTRQSLEQRAAALKKSAAASRDEPWVARVAPGETATIVWHFSRPGEFHFGCAADGHLADGMIGRIRIIEPADHKH